MIKISVIITAYGYPTFLEESVNSVINQTISDWELIIVDDNNPQTEFRKETEEIVTPFLNDSRIHYICHERNLNGAVARNTGVKVAKGEYISFLDSDDIYMPSRLEKCFNYLEQHKEYGCVYTGCEFRLRGKHYSTFNNPQTGNFLVETLASAFMLSTGSNIFMRASIVRELNGFDELFLRHQDYEFMVRFFKKYTIAGIKEVLVIKNNENLNRPKPNKMLEIKKQYLRKYKYIIDNLPLDISNYIYHCHAVAMAEHYLSVGNVQKGCEFYKLAKKHQRLSASKHVRCYSFFIIALWKKITKNCF